MSKKWFLRGTQLGQLSEDYLMIRNRLRDILTQCQKKEAILPYVYKAVQKAEETVKNMRKLQQIKEEIKQMKKEICWAQVETVEKVSRSLLFLTCSISC